MQSKNATSEPRLFRKTTVLTRHRKNQSKNNSKQSVLSDPGEDVSAISSNPAGAASDIGPGGGAGGGGNTSSDNADNGVFTEKCSKLQRQKAQSRKTFKFRKTRKDVKRLPTIDLNEVPSPPGSATNNPLPASTTTSAVPSGPMGSSTANSGSSSMVSTAAPTPKEVIQLCLFSLRRLDYKYFIFSDNFSTVVEEAIHHGVDFARRGNRHPPDLPLEVEEPVSIARRQELLEGRGRHGGWRCIERATVLAGRAVCLLRQGHRGRQDQHLVDGDF